MADKITKGDIQRKANTSNLSVSNLRGGRKFPIRYGKITRVDPKRMVVDLIVLNQTNVQFSNVAISFPGAGGRHFLGAMPEVGDMCVIGMAPAESGRSKRPVILGWYVPSTQAGYDWLNVRSHGPDELNLSPKQKVALEGLASERRHKLRQMEAGNVVASSSQGADLLLGESATLANRRGNEIILRDQDQALVVRSLQQFHAGAGFRTYSGMVQRDSTLLPTQVVTDTVDWASDRQVDGEGLPLEPSDLDETGDDAYTGSPAAVFATGIETDGATNPSEVLQRGLFIDSEGNFTVRTNDAVYGGKPMYRVSSNLGGNATPVAGVPTFTEYRVEVAHTSTGVLPVTEQTDGIDIDRLLTSPPVEQDGTTGGNEKGTTDPSLLNPNSPMIEFVLGTAIGNDPYYKPTEYGLPLVAKVTSESGTRETVIRAYDPDSDTLQDQLAFLIRSRDPEDPSKESFIALSKGGAWLTSFQGQGSKVAQESLRTGKQSFYGTDADGQSRVLQADGAISMQASSGRQSDNVGVEIKSEAGAVEIYGGGPNTAGAADGSTNPNSPSNSKMALKLESANGTQIQAAEECRIAAPEINLTENKVTNVSAASAFNVNSGDTISMVTKTLGVTINGAAEYLFGGPKDGLATNGPSHTVNITANPATGAIGGLVSDFSVLFGKVRTLIGVGRKQIHTNVGRVEISSMGPDIPNPTPGAGIEVETGVPFLKNGLDATPFIRVKVEAGVGAAQLKASKGPVSITGTTGTFITSIAKTQISAPYVNVIAPLSPFGGVLTDGCLDPVTGRPFVLSGTIGAPTFRVGP